MRRILLVAVVAALGLWLAPAAGAAYIAKSIDTMKESSDQADRGLTQAQIDQHMSQLKALGATYAAVETPMTWPTVYGQWVSSARKYGLRVWHRMDSGVEHDPSQSPATLHNRLKNFILSHPSFFRSGDILDGDSEADSDAYWRKWDGDPSVWWNGSNSADGTVLSQACQEFNAYLVGLKTTADSALRQKFITGVNTGIRSLSPWWATANCLTDKTIASLGGYLTLDPYFADDQTDPATVASVANQAMESWHARRPTAKVVFGEYGYSNNLFLDDATQAAVIHSVLATIGSKSYVYGLNYWVGAGGPGYGGSTNILTGGTGNWQPRQSAFEVKSFFALH